MLTRIPKNAPTSPRISVYSSVEKPEMRIPIPPSADPRSSGGTSTISCRITVYPIELRTSF